MRPTALSFTVAVALLWLAPAARSDSAPRPGAKTHWAFVAPRRSPLPQLGNAAWSRTPLDSFVLARLEAEGLAPSPEAARSTWARRVSLDLTGLSPDPDDVDAFIDDEGPGAFERFADRRLASPRFGERLAARWLEAARYADTSGYQTDGERQMWRWRDWVIDAFNAGMPFDQFTVEQLAGDLLTGATVEQRIATGFNRNHRGNSEGGIIPEEYLVEYAADRVDATATVWLGLTLACARCHDHKYDPISHEEFYQVFAYFNNVRERGKARKLGNSPPVVAAPTSEQQRELASVDAELSEARTRFEDLQGEIDAALRTWEGSLADAAPVDAEFIDGLTARFALDGSAVEASTGAAGEVEGPAAEFLPGRLGLAAALDGRTAFRFAAAGDFGFLDRFSIGAWVRLPPGGGGPLLSRLADRESAAGYELAIESGTDGGIHGGIHGGRVQFNLVKRWLDDAIRVETESALSAGVWHHVVATYDGSRWASGVRIYIDGELERLRVLVDDLNQSFKTPEPFRIGGRGDGARFTGSVDDARIWSRCLGADEVEVLATSEPLSAIAALPPGERQPRQERKLRRAFLAEHAPAPIRAAFARLRGLEAVRAALLDSFPTVMVMEEMTPPRPSFLLSRGRYDRPREQVDPGVPACLPPLPRGAAAGREGFARWLVDPAHPLTARVTVNRVWQMLFGIGLVKTVEDFGAQGERPSHPELLDWLGLELAERGWDLKRLLRTLVTSAAYRQSSRLRPELLGRDPENRLLARGPRLRLPAEMLRDQALHASGLLVAVLGGPSVKPYQPADLWKDLSGEDYVQDHGEKLYRRSIYTFWKRTNAPPAMSILDAPAREACSVRETRTNTPIQSLVLLNDVTFVEAARVLAQHVLKEGGDSPEARLSFAFRLLVARRPEPRELAVLMENLEVQRRRFDADPEAARALASAGEYPGDPDLDVRELAAYTAAANLILNLDEVLTKE
jgi:hypothetical protein